MNLALVLEMFLPKQVRVKYPMLTDAIPLVDDTSINDQDESIIKQRVSALRVPLSDMKLTYLKLCAGRREKHIQYVVRQLLLDICTTVNIGPFFASSHVTQLRLNFNFNAFS